MRALAKFVMLAIVIGFVAWLVPGIDVHGGAVWTLWIAVLWSFVNTVVGFVLRLLTLPLIVLTFGLILLVVNAALVGITAAISSHLDVDGFFAALVGGFLISVFSGFGELLVGRRRRRT